MFATVADGHLVTASAASAAKTADLRSGRPTSLATSAGGFDVVWTGSPHAVTGTAELAAVAAAYRRSYGWNVDIDREHDALTAPYAAPTAGPPPYVVFRIVPDAVHAFTTDGDHAGRPTRWEFR